MSENKLLQPGELAPDFAFEVKTSGGELEKHTLHELNQHCLLYFYPKDNTPGCTLQACGIRDNWDAFGEAGIQVVGVSKDSSASHEKFTNRFDLPFPLIADTDLAVSKAYGAFGPKKIFGKSFEGISRVSFLISPDNKILLTYPKAKTGSHATQVLTDFRNLAD